MRLVGGSGANERARIERVYRGYASDPGRRERWDPSNPGNVRIQRERSRAAADLLSEAGLWPLEGLRILEIGCGAGGVVAEVIGLGATPDRILGVDLLVPRLRDATLRVPGPMYLTADGAALPVRAATCGLVLAYTVFSSILDDDVAARIAAEVDRVLRPGGALLFYDFRVADPRNRHTRAMSSRSVQRLFPGYRARTRRLTLVPQLARRLGPLTGFAYTVLSTVPILRTHILMTLRKP